MQPIILCGGKNGRCVVFGKVDINPIRGQPVTLHDARMILWWENDGGLLDVAFRGPVEGSNLTPAVTKTVETVWQEWIAVSDKAAAAIEEWAA